jgi:hypothetical protein
MFLRQCKFIRKEARDTETEQGRFHCVLFVSEKMLFHDVLQMYSQDVQLRKLSFLSDDT